ncbi:MAG: hypothetical protein HKP25_16010 [Marinicaulis sp.]|nr:aspartyl protease family protein [Marinicaulis sp.]NNL90566.1 hypothetical protein [Marinicaulis sp.]
MPKVQPFGWLFAVFAVLLFATGCETTSSSLRVSPAEARAVTPPLASIPYEQDYGGWITIDVMVNGRGPYKFVVDTGATLTAVFAKAAQEDIFRPTGGRPRKILGVTGARFVDPTYVGEIRAGGLYMRDHIGVVIPDWNREEGTPDGILGLDFLARYCLVFDAEARRIDFYPADAPPTALLSSMKRTGLKFSTFNQRTSGLYVLDLQISGRRIPAILDLGANAMLMNYAAMRRMTGGIFVSTMRSMGSRTGTNLKGVFDDETRIQSIRTGPVKIAGVTWGRRSMLIHSAAIFRDLGVHRTAYGLIGADMFENRHFAIDFRNKRFYLAKDPVAAAP